MTTPPGGLGQGRTPLEATRLRRALWLLLPILLMAVALAATVRLRGALSVDNRHYVEMVTGVHAHGMPYTLNAYSEDFTDARPAFNVPKDGKLWGQYPPLYPFVAAPALALRGLAGIGQLNFLILAGLAFAVFLLGWRLSRDPMRGVVAAYLVLFATPVWASSTQTYSQPLLFCLLTLVPLAGLHALDAEAANEPRRARAFAWLAGLFGGLALATHLIAAPMALVALVVLGWVRPAASAGKAATILPERAGLVRLGWSLAGAAPPLVPVALLNHERFGSYNPVSYGTCRWMHCALFESKDLNASGLLLFFVPAFGYLAAVATALYFARRRRAALLGVVVLAGLALCVPSPFRRAVLGMAQTVYGYFVDLTPIEFGTLWSYGTYPDGLGHSRASWVLRSLLQTSPIGLLALAAGYARSGRGARALVVAGPCLGLVASLALFARFKPPYQFGDPYILLRYAVPASPFLAVLAADVLARLHWRRWHVGVVALVTVGVGLALFSQRTQEAYWLRFLVLRVTLVAGFASLLAVVWSSRRPDARGWQQVAASLAACCVALSLGVALCSDTATNARAQQSFEDDVAHLERLTPQRFAFAGYGPQTDHVLTLRAERDINYIDLLESPDWTNFRTLIDLWTDDGRPIFGMFPKDLEPPFAWPYADWDVRATLIDERLNLYRIEPPGERTRLTPEQLVAVRARLHDAWERRGRKAP